MVGEAGPQGTPKWFLGLQPRELPLRGPVTKTPWGCLMDFKDIQRDWLPRWLQDPKLRVLVENSPTKPGTFTPCLSPEDVAFTFDASNWEERFEAQQEDMDDYLENCDWFEVLEPQARGTIIRLISPTRDTGLQMVVFTDSTDSRVVAAAADFF
jgi:hypothetical protein